MPYVYSTMSSDQAYAVYPPAKDVDTRKIVNPTAIIMIYGGANVINQNLVTPKGVMTKVTEEELNVLETLSSFRRHKDRFFIRVEKSKVDPDKIAAQDMREKDQSAQLDDSDFDPEKSPVVNG